MFFAIQASKPAFDAELVSPDDDTIAEAIQTVFRVDTEHAVIFWGATKYPIILSYKNDFGVIIDDWIILLDWLHSSSSGETTIEWSSNTFACTWKLSVKRESVHIQPRWNCVLGSPPEQSIEVNIEQLRAELSEPLRVILSALRGHPSCAAIQARVDQSPSRGVLYR